MRRVFNKKMFLAVGLICGGCILAVVVINTVSEPSPAPIVVAEMATTESTVTEVTIAATEHPTAIVVPTNTLEPPSPTPVRSTPTATAVPLTSTPTKTPSFAELYATEMGGYVVDMGAALGELGSLLQTPDLTNNEWRLDVAVKIAVIKLSHQGLQNMDVPARLVSFHSQVLDASSDCNESMLNLTQGLDNLDSNALDRATNLMFSCGNKMNGLARQVESVESAEQLAQLPTLTPTTAPPTIAPTSTPVPPTPLPKTDDFGVVKRVNNWQMSLYDVKRTKTVYFFGDPETAQGVWLIPFVEFTNHSSGTRSPYEDLDFYIQDDRGQTIELFYNDGSAGAAWQFQAGDLLDDIQPGQLIGVALAVDVPLDLGDAWLRTEQNPNFVIYLGNVNDIPPEE